MMFGFVNKTVQNTHTHTCTKPTTESYPAANASKYFQTISSTQSTETIKIKGEPPNLGRLVIDKGSEHTGTSRVNTS